MGLADKKLNVLIVHNYYKVHGGEDVVVANEKRLLLENNNNVFMYSRNNSSIKNSGILNKIKLALNTIYSIKTYKEVKKIIKEKNIDIVHVHNTLPLISPSVYYAAFKMKKPIVQTLHNFRFLCPKAILFRNGKVCMECINSSMMKSVKYKCYRNSKVQTLLMVIMLKLHKALKTYNKISAYIALTQFDKEILKNDIDENKIYIKPNFIYRNNVNKNKKNYFMFVGRLDEIKGAEILIKSFENIKDSELLIFGDGPLKEKLSKYVKHNNLSNIIFKGHVSQDVIIDYLSKAKAVIVPSQCFESFGMVIIEAFSVGTPAIGRNIGSIGTLINNKVNGLLFDKNEELAEKINLLNNDQILLEKLIQGAIESSKKYMADENYKILMNIYKSAIDNNLRGNIHEKNL